MERERPIRIETVMELTGYSRSYVYKLVHLKKIPCRKPGGKTGKTQFFESEILGFLDRGRQYADYEVAEKAEAILNGEAKQVSVTVR